MHCFCSRKAVLGERAGGRAVADVRGNERAAIQDLAQCVEVAAQLSASGRATEAVARARRAADSLDALGERYTAARLLVDFLPVLVVEDRLKLAAEAVTRLTAMGALRSAAEAGGQAAA